MKRTNVMRIGNLKLALLALLAAAVALPAAAGDKSEKGYKCSMSTQECLDMMAGELKNRGWVGIEMEQVEGKGMKIKRVIPGSPAEAAGLKVGDLLNGMNGIPFAEENHEKLNKEREQHVPGRKVTYSLVRAGKQTEVVVTLGQLPTDVLYQWIGMHMIDHAEAPAPQAKK